MIAEVGHHVAGFAFADFPDRAGERATHGDAMHAGDQSGHESRSDGKPRFHLLVVFVGHLNLNGDRIGAMLHGCGDYDRPSADQKEEGKGHQSGWMLEECFHFGREIDRFGGI